MEKQLNDTKKEIQLDATQWFIEIMIRSTCFGHYYAHHQEFETIQMLLEQHPSTRTHNLKPSTRPTTSYNKSYVPHAVNICNSLKLLMIGIIVPETC